MELVLCRRSTTVRFASGDNSIGIRKKRWGIGLAVKACLSPRR